MLVMKNQCYVRMQSAIGFIDCTLILLMLVCDHNKDLIRVIGFKQHAES